jgi:hypothetical protein
MSDDLEPATDRDAGEFGPDSTAMTRSIAGFQLAVLLVTLGVVLAALIGVVGFLTVAGIREFIG